MAGTVTQTLVDKTGNNQVIWTLSWVADAAAATVPSTESTWDFAGLEVQKVVTDPGSTAPTDNYDIVLNDSDSLDVMGGTLANRSTSASQQTRPLLGGAGDYWNSPVRGKLTMVLTGNAVNSATGTVIVYLKRI